MDEKHMILELKHTAACEQRFQNTYMSFQTAALNSVCANCNRHTSESAKSDKRLIRPAVKGITAAA